jgi:hypothetical protein
VRRSRGRGGRWISPPPPPPHRDLELDERLAIHRTEEEQAAHEAELKRRNTLLNAVGSAESEADFQAGLRMFADRLERRGYRIERVATAEDSRWRLFDTDGTEITFEMLAQRKP